MNFIAAIDISTFIWSKEDYNANTNYYYELLYTVPTVFEQIKKHNLPILLSNELCQILSTEFPYCEINEIGFSDYNTLTLLFLTSTKKNIYEQTDENGFTTIPDIIKDFFKEEIKEESNYLIIHLFNNAIEHKFITYKHFYNSQSNLLINNKHNISSEIDTLCFYSEKEIVDFFEKFKIKFVHNPKHDTYKSGGRISTLSCYNERDGNTTKAQELLDNAFFWKEHYYNFDLENKVYVRFIKTSELIYHGHDLTDVENNIPNEVKNKFYK